MKEEKDCTTSFQRVEFKHPPLNQIISDNHELLDKFLQNCTFLLLSHQLMFS